MISLRPEVALPIFDTAKHRIVDRPSDHVPEHRCVSRRTPMVDPQEGAR